MTFHQGRDVTVVRPGQEIALPMTRHRPIFNRCRAVTDRDDILDLPPSIANEARPFRSTDRALRPKIAKQFLLKHPAGLNKPVSYTHLRAHETDSYLVCRLLL